MKKKLLFAFGTRPEAIKLAPVILEAQKHTDDFSVCVVVTAQHREMLDEVLDVFNIKPDHDFNIMRPCQSIFYVTYSVFENMEPLMEAETPDVVIVQGDTTTTFAGALSGYYNRSKIAHVEAGLRTHNKFAPFPEEINRKITSSVADYNFAPTEWARDNLRKEGYPDDSIYITGNTVIDALSLALEKIDQHTPPLRELSMVKQYERTILLTGHRRENFGEPFRRVCEAFRHLAENNPDTCFVYPVHLNPNVQQPVNEILQELSNFYLLSPLPYLPFIWLMNHSYFLITDSGGIQEEATSLGKPILLTRDFTERPEGVDAGTIKLVGTDAQRIIRHAQELLENDEAYRAMSKASNPFGDGKAAQRIIEILRDKA